jgi:Xaa-Pro dipeptidase
MPVGGVRIEDDILITSRGYENLTKAPKGDAMFDIIRGRKSTSSTARPQANANAPTGVSEPPLFRAPGCPLRATPPGLHSIKRASTMPNQISAESQRNETDRRNHAMHFRRAMTTDERVQHWRQSQQQLPFQQPTATRDKPITMCGALRDDYKHLYIGDGCSDTSPTRSLPPCPDCAILAQALERLRQNLALSKQGSPTQTHASQDAFGTPAQSTTSPRTARRNTNEPSQKIVEVSTNTPQTHSQIHQEQTAQGSRLTKQARSRKSLPHMLQPQDAQPEHLRTTVFTVPEASRSQEQENVSVPIRAHMALQQLQQDRRRPSNHTDDRDWMA